MNAKIAKQISNNHNKPYENLLSALIRLINKEIVFSANNWGMESAEFEWNDLIAKFGPIAEDVSGGIIRHFANLGYKINSNCDSLEISW